MAAKWLAVVLGLAVSSVNCLDVPDGCIHGETSKASMDAPGRDCPVSHGDDPTILVSLLVLA